MINASPYEPIPLIPLTFAGDFNGIAPLERTASYYMEKIKILLRQDKFNDAFKTLEKCVDLHAELPDWQFGNLREVAAKVMHEIESIFSGQELKRLHRRLSGTGLAPSQLVSNNNAPSLT